MNEQDDMRKWIIQNINVTGRGTKKKLADFLGIRPIQVTRMLNTDPEKETRVIKADEFEKIKIFLGKAPFVLSPDMAAAKRKKLAAILERSSPEQQEALLDFIEAWSRKPKKS